MLSVNSARPLPMHSSALQGRHPAGSSSLKSTDDSFLNRSARLLFM